MTYDPCPYNLWEKKQMQTVESVYDAEWANGSTEWDFDHVDFGKEALFLDALPG